MKKGLSKLILSGAAVAAVAATLGTSTYAWYTTNPTVSANNIVGASSDTGSSSIYIAKDTSAANKTWSSSVTFASSDFASFKLVPVQPTSTAGEFKLLDGTTTAPTAAVFKFTLWFKSSKTADTATASNGIDLYIKEISLQNTSAKLPTFDNLLAGDTTYAEADYGVANTDATYAVDFCRALAMEVVDVSTTTTVYTAGLRQKFALDDYETPISTTDAATVITTGKAHEYYNQVMPDAAGKKAGEDGFVAPLSSTAISTGKALTDDLAKAAITTLDPTGTNATARKLDFYVYLNGWNDFCYDACQGQEFTLNMKFTNKAADAIGA